MENQTPYIYLRILRHADHTVFGVEDGQKRYWDEQFRRYIAYASGQQVKRSILETLTSALNEKPAPVTFYFDAKDLKEQEVTTPGDPRFADQLLGGWMIAESAKEGAKGRTVKRRSPLSISAMRPLHPLLSNVDSENLSFDRSDRPNVHKVVVRDKQGNELSEEEIAEKLGATDRSLRRKWVQGNRRTTGLFVFDVAIDLRTLFSVSTNQLEPELKQEVLEALEEDGWIKSENAFGECLVAPKERQEQIIDALADALLNWRIMTNQSRTFSPMETLAIAISPNANKAAGAIRAKLIEEGEERKAKPIVDDSIEGADVYVTLPGAGYFATNIESADALENARQKLTDLLRDFDYEKQI